VVVANGETPNQDAETVGLQTYDEPPDMNTGVTGPLGTTPNGAQDGRFWWLNLTWNFIVYGGLNPVSSSAEVLSTLVTTPNGTQRHIDLQSVDIYWFAGVPAMVPYQGGLIYGLGSNMTPEQIRCGCRYGDMVDRIRAFQTTCPAPLAQFIEDGGPYTEDTSASTYITPPEMSWAVWSSIIHGARQIIWLIAQLAPQINSPQALGYVTTDPPADTFSGIETRATYCNGQSFVFAATRYPESQTNISVTFTTADQHTGPIVVIGESRTLTAANGVFTDTFAEASTIHIYQVP
jgi:hypothetical protein